MPGATTRVLDPPRTVDPYYHQAQKMAELEGRIALLERGDQPIFYEIGLGAPLPGFQTSYANYLTSTWAKAGYWKVGNRVYLQGLLYSSSTSGIGTIFTLPLGLRPALGHIFVTFGQVGANRIDVNANGTVINQSNGGWSATPGAAVAGGAFYVSLDGISFALGR